MNVLLEAMLPELILAIVACMLFLLGITGNTTVRRLVIPLLAAAALVVAFWLSAGGEWIDRVVADEFQTFRVYEFARYIKMLACGVGVLLVLLAWPTNRDGSGNPALDYGYDGGEFFGLMLLSIAGILLVAGANDIILLFLGIELASIPTYIMVSVSRPVPAAQEAGVKYFFLGAMSAAVMLFGFSYLYGTTGLTALDDIRAMFFRSGHVIAEVSGGDVGGAPYMTPWQQLAVLMLIAGFAFKIVAVPLHFYAGDVYQGAATPVTAFLSFVPKLTGMTALIKLLYVISGGAWAVPPYVAQLLWVLAVLTMTVGNVLGLLQFNVKRVFAYSSIAHTGYMLVGLTAMSMVGGPSPVRREALQGVLFYLAAYGIMNAGAFGVLMLLPARDAQGLGPGFRRRAIPPATTAETFEDLAGTGRRHPGLGLAMAVCCFSLIGLPLTVGFFGKLLLIRPALMVGTTAMNWLVAITMVNAAISAAYYLRIVGTMFLRSEPEPYGAEVEPAAGAAAAPAATTAGAGPAVGGIMPLPLLLAVGLSAGGTLLFGSILPATQVLTLRAGEATNIERTNVLPYDPGITESAAAR